MSSRVSPSRLAKHEFYDQADIAAAYEEQRFGGSSGAWVHARETELVLSLLPASGRVLDLGCGTGRLTRELARRGEPVGLDAASAMLSRARASAEADFVRGDAFSLPFAAESFDAVVALRVAFHFKALSRLLAGMRRVVKPGGALVFDTYLWSPRAWLPLDAAHWGAAVYIHSPEQVQDAARKHGLEIAAETPCFLFSPYLYRRLPLSVVQLLARAEPRLPLRLHARVFWKLVRAD